MVGPLHVLVSSAVLAACAATASAPASPSKTARIEVEAGAVYRVSAVAESSGAASGTYALTVERVGAAGRSRSKQGGAFALEAGQSDTLSTSAVNVAPGDSVRVGLEVEWADGTATTDTFERVAR